MSIIVAARPSSISFLQVFLLAPPRLYFDETLFTARTVSYGFYKEQICVVINFHDPSNCYVDLDGMDEVD